MSLAFARRHTFAPRAARGFTLLEVVITVVLAVILVTIALPSFRELTIRSNVTTLTNSLVIALNSARAEAVRRGTLVELVPVSSTSWSGGWYIKADTNFNAGFATTIGTQSAAPTGYKICPLANGTGAPGTASSVIFDATGALQKPRLLTSTGNARRDAAVREALQRVRVDRAPPPAMAQPLTLVLLPRDAADPDAPRCENRP